MGCEAMDEALRRLCNGAIADALYSDALVGRQQSRLHRGLPNTKAHHLVGLTPIRWMWSKADWKQLT